MVNNDSFINRLNITFVNDFTVFGDKIKTIGTNLVLI